METTTGYMWNAKTFEFEGSIPVLLGEGISIPSCVTLKKPQEMLGMFPVWDEVLKKWNYVEDHRGEEGFDEEGKKIRINTLGSLPGNFFKENPEDEKIRKEVEIAEKRMRPKREIHKLRNDFVDALIRNDTDKQTEIARKYIEMTAANEGETE